MLSGPPVYTQVAFSFYVNMLKWIHRLVWKKFNGIDP
jgi:hypothetical protein